MNELLMNTEYDEDVMLDTEIESEACPVCAGDAAELGGLGCLTWYRCVCCGTEFSREECHD